MKKISYPLLIAGALVGLAFVLVLKPERRVVVDDFLVEPGQKPRRPVSAVMASFGECETASDRLRVAAGFRGFSSSEFAEALQNSGYLTGKGRLSLAAKCLLIAWAEKDAGAALEWSWLHLRVSGEWRDAFEEVVRTWVENDPVAVIEFFHETRKSEDELTRSEAEESEEIVLDEETVEALKVAFFSHDSALALLAIQNGLGWPRGVYPRRMDFTGLLDSVEEVEAAQEDWEEIEDSGRLLGSLARRLGELVPEPPRESESTTVRVPKFPGLSLSANSKGGPVSQRTERQGRAWWATRIDFERTVTEAQTLEVAEREAVFLAMYDSWHAAHPGEEPDLTLLPEEARQLWRDLDGLGPIDDSFSSSTWKSEEFEKE